MSSRDLPTDVHTGQSAATGADTQDLAQSPEQQEQSPDQRTLARFTETTNEGHEKFLVDVVNGAAELRAFLDRHGVANMGSSGQTLSTFVSELNEMKKQIPPGRG